MNVIQQFRMFFVFCMTCLWVLPVAANPPDERDQQVLQALMLHLVADPKFDLTNVSTNGATIVLHTHTPEKTGFLQSEQIHGEIDDRKLPTGAERDMRRRNTPDNAKAGSYEAIKASYTNLIFSAPIVVTNLTEIWKGRSSATFFEKAHPQARGWLKAYLPGYSANGNQAVVRANIGPWEHAAMLTAVLEKRENKWIVVWYHVTRFL